MSNRHQYYVAILLIHVRRTGPFFILLSTPVVPFFLRKLQNIILAKFQLCAVSLIDFSLKQLSGVHADLSFLTAN